MICTEPCYQSRTTHQPNKERRTEKEWTEGTETAQPCPKPFSDTEEFRLHPNIQLQTDVQM